MERMTQDICAATATAFNKKGPLPKGFSIRAATVKDTDAIMDVGCKCFESDQPETHKIKRFLTIAHASIIGLFSGSEMIGYLHLEANARHKSLYLNTVAVLKEYRGKGLGNALYVFANELAQKIKAASIWCHVDAHDKHAIYMLTKNGYVIERTEDPYYDDGRAALIMRRSFA